MKFLGLGPGELVIVVIVLALVAVIAYPKVKALIDELISRFRKSDKDTDED